MKWGNISNLLMADKGKYIHYFVYASLLVLILAVNITRFIGLEKSPPGFHIDELSMAVTVQCLSTEGVDALNRPYPLFGNVEYGSPKPPTYIYPAAFWTKVFGYSIASFRAFSAFIVSMTLIGLFFLARFLFGRKCAFWVLLAATLSPWVFQLSRVAIEAPLSTCFIAWGMYFFFRSNKAFDALISGALFSMAIYSYPAARAFVPMFIIPMAIFKKNIYGLTIREIVLFFTSLLVLMIPLGFGLLDGKYMTRFNAIGIFSETYLHSIGKNNNFVSILAVFMKNYLAHLKPAFLFVSGDRNLVYSSRFTGLFGWLDTLALIVAVIFFIQGVVRKFLGRLLVERKDFYFILLIWAGMLLSIVPAALTWQDIPHSLRMVFFWPFLSLFSGYIFWKLSNQCFIFLAPIVCVSFAFSVLFLNYYFTDYQKIAYIDFDAYTKGEVLAAKTELDWRKFIYRYRFKNYHVRYYVMNYHPEETCSSSRIGWRTLRGLPVE